MARCAHPGAQRNNDMVSTKKLAVSAFHNPVGVIAWDVEKLPPRYTPKVWNFG
ncbi:hypothetical protein GCM10007338_11810 [Corynebacterium pelargi]|nr:hypothetical protein GCM10007338_11810 [Corynebacterium pelargi]